VTSDLHRSVAARLAEHEQQYTANRRAIVEALAAADGPITLPDLLAGDGSLAQSSAYRSVAVLVDVGVVRRMTHVGDHALFELDENLTEHHHHHLIGERCRVVVDVTLPDRVEHAIDTGFDAVAQRAGFAPTHHAVDLYGVCSDCRD
jgi:Fur family ferric uptake transcriptional regulator